MRPADTVSLFPFLSVLLSTMGVLSFLAVTFLLFSQQEQHTSAPEQPVDVRWVGAPEYVRPMLVECRKERVLVHHPDGTRPQFTRQALYRESERVKRLQERAVRMLGSGASRDQQWVFMKTIIPQDPVFSNSFTMTLHRLEIDNIRGQSKASRIKRYPILLVYPQGIEACDQAAYIVETTTRLNMGLEPMLEGWEVPYRDKSS